MEKIDTPQLSAYLDKIECKLYLRSTHFCAISSIYSGEAGTYIFSPHSCKDRFEPSCFSIFLKRRIGPGRPKIRLSTNKDMSELVELLKPVICLMLT